MQTKKYITLFFITTLQISSLFFSNSASADDGFKWSELRLFGASNKFTNEPTALNNLSAVDNTQKLTDLTGFGLEADARVKSWLKVGTRIKGIWNSVYPVNPPSPATAYLQVTQYSAGILARIPLAEKDLLYADAFAELGLANTKIDVQTISTGKATFTNDSGFFQRAGVTVGIGSPAVKFYVEGGQEWNTLNQIKFEGTLPNSITSVDFTGPYYAIGLIISGIPSWIKPGSITVGK